MTTNVLSGAFCLPSAVDSESVPMILVRHARPTVHRQHLADPRLTRQFNSIAQSAEEQIEVRIWGGILFRNSLVVSDQVGRKIASLLVTNTMEAGAVSGVPMPTGAVRKHP